jgi:DNA-binding XRE family transcriptional regulator
VILTVHAATTPGCASEIRLLFAFDPRREAIFLVGGDKAGNWEGWYREAIPLADERFAQHLAEMRAAAGLSQAELADALGVSQARVSKIEHGEISCIDVVRAYVAALGGSVDVVARLGDRSWKVA